MVAEAAAKHLTPTILELAGAAVPAGAVMDGRRRGEGEEWWILQLSIALMLALT